MYDIDIVCGRASVLNQLSETHTRISKQYKEFSNIELTLDERANIDKKIESFEKKIVGLKGQLEIYNQLLDKKIFRLSAKEQVMYLTNMMKELKQLRKGTEGTIRVTINGKIKAIKESLCWTVFVGEQEGSFD